MKNFSLTIGKDFVNFYLIFFVCQWFKIFFVAINKLKIFSIRLVTQGFYRPGHAQRSSYGSNDSTSSNNIRSGSQPPRVPLSSQFLLELLHALYYAAFNGQEYLANQSIESIHQRACYESFVDVQLLANAIKHSLRLSVTSKYFYNFTLTH